MQRLGTAGADARLEPCGAGATTREFKNLSVRKERSKVHIAIGCDEAGKAIKQRLAAKLTQAGHHVADAASAQADGRCGYAEQVAMLLLRRDAERGIVVSNRGVGAALLANRVPGIRAALCNDAHSAHLGAKEEGMNVLVLPLHSLEDRHALEVVDAYLSATLAAIEMVGGLPPRRLQRVLEHIREHLATELKVAELALSAGMSQYYFSKLFKMSTGRTPHQYVMQQRIERAQQLLREGPMSLSDIGRQVGFETQSHFTSVFRRLVGATPKVFRQMHQSRSQSEDAEQSRRRVCDRGVKVRVLTGA